MSSSGVGSGTIIIADDRHHQPRQRQVGVPRQQRPHVPGPQRLPEGPPRLPTLAAMRGA